MAPARAPSTFLRARGQKPTQLLGQAPGDSPHPETPTTPSPKQNQNNSRRPPSASALLLAPSAASPLPPRRCNDRLVARAKPKRPKKGGKKGGGDDDEDDAAEFRQKPAAAPTATATASLDTTGADDGDETPVMASGMAVTDDFGADAAATVAAATVGDSRGGSVGISSGIRLENVSWRPSCATATRPTPLSLLAAPAAHDQRAPTPPHPPNHTTPTPTPKNNRSPKRSRTSRCCATCLGK